MAVSIRTKEAAKRVLAPLLILLTAAFSLGAAFQPVFQAPPASSMNFWEPVSPFAGPAVAPFEKKQSLTKLEEMLLAERAVSVSA